MRSRDIRRVEFSDVEVVRDTGLLLQCRVGTKVVAVPLVRLLAGTNISHVGDRGVLVLSRELALNVGLIPEGGIRSAPPGRLLDPGRPPLEECQAEATRLLATHRGKPVALAVTPLKAESLDEAAILEVTGLGPQAARVAGA